MATTTGPELLGGSEAMVLAPIPLQAFMAYEAQLQQTSFHTPLRSPPRNLSAGARGGGNLALGYQQSTWIIDGDPRFGYLFYFDRDNDGDMTDEQPEDIKLVNGVWQSVIRANGLNYDGRLTEIVFHVSVERHRLVVKYGNLRRGILPLGEHRIAFAVVADRGHYGIGSSKVFFDFDRDGKLDMSNSGDEFVYARDKVVSLNGVNYDFSIESSGKTVALSPTQRAPISRLRTGNKVGNINVVTLQGVEISLSEHPRHYLLLGFWPLLCPGCLDEVSALQPAGSHRLISVWITPDDDREMLAQLESSNLNVVIEDVDSSKIYTLFGAEGPPSFALIDPGGVLLCRNCELEDVKRILRSTR